MRRPAWLAVIAGVLLLAGLVALKMAMSTDDESPPAAQAPGAAAPTAQSPTAESAPAAPAPAPGSSAPAAPPQAPVAVAPNAPELPEIVNAFTPSEKKPPIANKALLREQVAAVEPEIADCVKQASYTGSGSAVLTYQVTPNKQKQDVAIESTGVEYDGTTIDNQPLLDCLKDTAKDMKFKYVPDTDGVFAFRRVKLDNGKVVENTFMDFHYVR
jgi:hypothetical protein